MTTVKFPLTTVLHLSNLCIPLYYIILFLKEKNRYSNRLISRMLSSALTVVQPVVAVTPEYGSYGKKFQY